MHRACQGTGPLISQSGSDDGLCGSIKTVSICPSIRPFRDTCKRTANNPDVFQLHALT